MGAMLSDTQRTTIGESDGWQTQVHSIALSALLDEAVRARYLSWIGPEVQIKKQTSKDGTGAEYRAVAQKFDTGGSAMLAITLSTQDGRCATAEITKTSGATDWFNGDVLPNEWEPLLIKLELLE
jgi:hypothetical protein